MKCMEYEVEGPRPRGRRQRTWREVAEKHCQACKLKREGPLDGCVLFSYNTRDRQTQTDRQTDSETDRHRQTDRQTVRQTSQCRRWVHTSYRRPSWTSHLTTSASPPVTYCSFTTTHQYTDMDYKYGKTTNILLVCRNNTISILRTFPSQIRQSEWICTAHNRWEALMHWMH